MPTPNRSRFVLTLALFVVSGAAGLVDQICFSKYLSYVVGSTAYAISTVLASFMIGLALGSALGGRFSSRVERPLFAYGVLEVLVGVAVLGTPFAFEALTPLYASLARGAPDSLVFVSVIRWLLAMLIVVVPTVAMGATLPLLTGLINDGEGVTARVRERRLGALYAANTLGGAVGALGAAYFLLASLGLTSTLRLAAAASALVGVVAIVAGRSRAPASAPEATEEPTEDTSAERGPEEQSGLGLVLALAFASGFLVFEAEVVFTHLLALIIGNSVYAFGLILAVFLICLFVGAAQAPMLHGRLGLAALPLGLAATSVALAGTLPAWDRLPLLFGGLGEEVTTFAGREAVRGLAAFAILVLPTTMMGLTFPLLLQRIATTPRVAERVGLLTATNTVGAVVGSLVTGYVVLPRLGSEKTLMLLTLTFAVLAFVTLGGLGRAAKRAAVGLAAVGVVVTFAVPRWDLARLTAGSNVYFTNYEPPDEVVFVREDIHGGVTTVLRRKNVYTLYTNGKFQGNTGWEMNAQRYFAHYPSLFVKNFDRALVIGLGTATTLGTVAAYPWKSIDVVEISPAISEAAGRFFKVQNRNALEDPRVSLIHDDGRNYLLVTEQKYDLIGMELSSVWFAGASSLYSAEFYKNVKAHLVEGGVFEQWVQLHHVYRTDFATLVNTLRRAFSHVAVYYGGGQGILIASMQPLRSSPERIAELSQRPEVASSVPRSRQLAELLGDVLVVDESLDAFLEESAKLADRKLETMTSTDDNLYLEYATPRGNVLPWSTREKLVAEIRKHRRPQHIQALRGP